MTVRRPRFSFAAGFDKEWLGGDAFRSQLFNSLSMMFPVGEQYFIDSLRRGAKRIGDPVLQAEIQDFIGQEAIHRHIHGQFNRQLAKHGLKNLIGPFIDWRICHSGWLGPLDHVAITAAYEHFTAIFGELAIEDATLLAGADPQLHALWTWHAIEEVEHKAVSLATYRALDGSEGRRIVWFLYACIFLLNDLTIQTVYNLHRSGNLFSFATWRSAGHVLFGRRGLVWRVLRHGIRYMKPGYFPRHDQSLTQAQQWLAANGQWFEQRNTSSIQRIPGAIS
jgi:predicted metal-dependent hydrolase